PRPHRAGAEARRHREPGQHLPRTGHARALAARALADRGKGRRRAAGARRRQARAHGRGRARQVLMSASSIFASVVFLRIQEFARRPVSEQARLRAQLEAVVAVTGAEVEPAGRIVLDASDGAVIVVLDDPRAALQLAERALTAGAAGLPLSAGLNH